MKRRLGFSFGAPTHDMTVQTHWAQKGPASVPMGSIMSGQFSTDDQKTLRKEDAALHIRLTKESYQCTTSIITVSLKRYCKNLDD